MSQFVLSRPHISDGSTEYNVGNRNVNTILYALRTCRSAATLRGRHPMNRAIPAESLKALPLRMSWGEVLYVLRLSVWPWRVRQESDNLVFNWRGISFRVFE